MKTIDSDTHVVEAVDALRALRLDWRERRSDLHDVARFPSTGALERAVSLSAAEGSSITIATALASSGSANAPINAWSAPAGRKSGAGP